MHGNIFFSQTKIWFGLPFNVSFRTSREKIFFIHSFRIVKWDDISVETLKNLVQKEIPDSKLIRHVSKEVTFLLPSDYTRIFPDLFSVLNENEDIESYGVSMTTLEEVKSFAIL